MCKYNCYVCVVGLFCVIFGFGVGFVVDYFFINHTQVNSTECIQLSKNKNERNISSLIKSALNDINYDQFQYDYKQYFEDCTEKIKCKNEYIFKQMGRSNLDSLEKVEHKVLLQYCDSENPSKFYLSNSKGLMSLELKFNYSKDTACTFSTAGKVEGQIIFVNYASYDDFQTIKNHSVQIKDKLCIARIGSKSVQYMVNNALRENAKALLLYSESNASLREDFLEYKKTKLIIHFISPIDAYKILEILHGARIQKWNFRYYIGPQFYKEYFGHKVHLEINTKFEERKIENIIGRINGQIEPDRYVIVTNQRMETNNDALDVPTATLLGMAKIFGHLKQKEWKPRRTIILANFEAKEFGYIGLKEWVHHNWFNLFMKSVTFINVEEYWDENHSVFNQMKVHPLLLKSSLFLLDNLFQDGTKLFLVQNDTVSQMGAPSIDIYLKTAHTEMNGTSLEHKGLLQANYFISTKLLVFLSKHFADSKILPVAISGLEAWLSSVYSLLKISCDKLHYYDIDMGKLRRLIQQFHDSIDNFSVAFDVNITDFNVERILNDQLMQISKCFSFTTEKYSIYKRHESFVTTLARNKILFENLNSDDYDMNNTSLYESINKLFYLIKEGISCGLQILEVKP